MQLHRHQQQLQQLAKTDARHLVAHVVPGGGKSLLPIIAAAGSGLKVCWVVPRRSLQRQAEESFADPRFRAMLGHGLTIRSGSNDSDPCRGLDGYAITYQAIGERPEVHLDEFRRQRFLLVLDEFHHIIEKSRWEAAVRPMLDRAARVLLMTGTMETGSGDKLAFVPYNEHGYVDIGMMPSTGLVTCGRAEALQAGAINDISIELVDGKAEWMKGGEARCAGTLSGKGAGAREALLTSLQTGYAKHLLALCVQDWQERRKVDPTALLLVVAHRVAQAQTYLGWLGEMGISAAIATSDDSDAAQQAIIAFKAGRYEALVTVAMAYEGLDVPAITHVACLTHIRSKPWLEQMLARAVRINPATPEDARRLPARVFAPNDTMFLDAWARIQEERMLPVPEPTGAVGGGGGIVEELVPLGSSVTSHDLPATAQVVLPSDEERQWRQRIEKHVRSYAASTAHDVHTVNQWIKRRFGKSRTAMSLPELQMAYSWCEAVLK